MKTKWKNGGMPLWGINYNHWSRVGDEPFLDRKIFGICPWFGLFLTEIHKPDAADRPPHDHSRTFISWIVSGGYTEQTYRDIADVVLKTHRVRRHQRWSVHVMPRAKAHAITEVRGRLIALVLAGKSHGSWSFWTPRGKVDREAYNEAA
jgi:hypothetical protein